MKNTEYRVFWPAVPGIDGVSRGIANEHCTRFRSRIASRPSGGYQVIREKIIDRLDGVDPAYTCANTLFTGSRDECEGYLNTRVQSVTLRGHDPYTTTPQ